MYSILVVSSDNSDNTPYKPVYLQSYRNRRIRRSSCPSETRNKVLNGVSEVVVAMRGCARRARRGGAGVARPGAARRAPRDGRGARRDRAGGTGSGGEACKAGVVPVARARRAPAVSCPTPKPHSLLAADGLRRPST